MAGIASAWVANCRCKALRLYGARKRASVIVGVRQGCMDDYCGKGMIMGVLWFGVTQHKKDLIFTFRSAITYIIVYEDIF